MDAELKQRLVEYLDTLESAVKSGGDFVAEHAPETVRQLLVYGIYDGLCGLAFSLVATVACLIAARRFFHLNRNGEKYNSYDIPCFLFVLMAVFGLAVSGHALSCLLKVWLAPNVYILERIAEIVK